MNDEGLAVFVSYRRNDVAPIALAISERLDPPFRVFIDEGRIPFGAKFPQWLADELDNCNVLLVVIGPKWLEEARKRSTLLIDWVRIEVTRGLESERCKVIPVVVDGAMTDVEESDPRWTKDIRDLQSFPVKSSSLSQDLDRLCCILCEFGEEIPVHNSVGMSFRTVGPGKFMMGSPENEKGRDTDPSVEYQHHVRITESFRLATSPVTQRQYTHVMGTNPSYFSPIGQGSGKIAGRHEDTLDFPVESVSWNDAQEFCQRLSGRTDERQRRMTYRLPSEAEWEFACRAISEHPFCIGDSISANDACFDSSQPYCYAELGFQRSTPSRVKSFRANGFGIFDMHGNVWEWCEDYYSPDYFKYSAVDNPLGPAKGDQRVLRGGSWTSSAADCRSASRLGIYPNEFSSDIGFRVVCELR